MHKVVPIVFKILMGSVLLMAILDTTLLVTEIISIHSKVSAFATTVQMEIASNNCLPEEMGKAFDTYLIDNLSNYKTLLDGKDIRQCVEHNMTGEPGDTMEIEVDGELRQVESLCEANAKDYGEFTTLAIKITLHPDYVYYGQPRGDLGLHRRGASELVLNYVYHVPCLRYLK